MTSSDKFLTDKGKEKFFKSIKEYVDANVNLCDVPKLDLDEYNKRAKRLKKAEEDLKAKIMALKIPLEE